VERKQRIGHAFSGSNVTAGDHESDEVFRLREEALPWRPLEGEVLALDLDRSVYLAANESGALLWKALAQGAKRSELTQILVETYGLEPALAREDADAFLAEAAERELLP
jgi:hypothetical protein